MTLVNTINTVKPYIILSKKTMAVSGRNKQFALMIKLQITNLK